MLHKNLNWHRRLQINTCKLILVRWVHFPEKSNIKYIKTSIHWLVATENN